MEVGFIGLGNMGAPMARNLAAAGHSVAGFDVAGVRVEGVAAAASAAAAARGRDAVITMLPDGAILRAVYAEIVPAGRSGALFIDCSTVDVASARAAAAEAKAAGLAGGRRPGLRRHRRRGGRHAHLHGRRQRRGLRRAPGRSSR